MPVIVGTGRAAGALSAMTTTLARLHHSLAGVEAGVDFNTIAAMPIAFRPSGPEFQVELSGAVSRVLSVWRTRSLSGFLSEPKDNMPDVVSLRFVSGGAFIRRDHGRGHAAGRGQALLLATTAMLNEEATPNFASIGATLNRTTLERSAAALTGGADRVLLEFGHVLPIDAPPVVALLRTLQSLLARVRFPQAGSDIFVPLIEEILCYQLLTAWPHALVERRAERADARLVRTAADYIEAHLGRDMRLSDVAAATATSVRSLQAAFRTVLGISPVQFIIGKRLDRARTDLLDPYSDDRVGSVARRWGFNNLGDFARRYRDRFGELPRYTRGGPAVFDDSNEA